MCLEIMWVFPDDSVSKESACSVGDLGLVPGLERSPGGGHGNPLQYSCLENPHGQRSLVGYSPWGCKESDITHRNHMFLFLHPKKKKKNQKTSKGDHPSLFFPLKFLSECSLTMLGISREKQFEKNL